MKVLVILLITLSTATALFFGGSGGNSVKKQCEPVPEADVCRNASELISSKGYPCEDHTVQTEDGFLLGVQRIPCGRRGQCLPGKPVVFLQHGLLSSSADWVANLANQSIAFILADAGFDVWLGNMRGNTYSMKHLNYTPGDDKFWAWSFDEMAKYDLTAMVDYALAKSGQKQLYYIGHSQGTMIGFVEFGRNPDLAKKVKKFFALGPVSTVGHIKSPLRIFAYLTPEVKELFWVLGVHDFLPNGEIVKVLGSTVCKTFTRFICSDIIFLFCGFDKTQLNMTRLPVYVAHDPAGTSVQNMIHFAQLVRSGKFQSYDYGWIGNMERYGQLHPPEYNVSKVEVPTYLYWAGNDWLADPEDVKENLLPKLPNIQNVSYVAHWQHLDFLWAMDARKIVYDPIVALLKKDHPDMTSAKSEGGVGEGRNLIGMGGPRITVN